MKKRLAISFIFVFMLGISAPVFAEVLPQEPQKTETKKETEKKAECPEKKKECNKAEKKACCDKKKAEQPKK